MIKLHKKKTIQKLCAGLKQWLLNVQNDQNDRKKTKIGVSILHTKKQITKNAFFTKMFISNKDKQPKQEQQNG